MLLKIVLKCLPLRVILDLLNQVVNVNAIRSFHHRIWHSWDAQVDVFVINLMVELVRVITMFERTNFLHFVRAFFHKFPRSIVIFHDAFFFIFHTCSPVRSEELSSPCNRLPTISWVTNFPVRSPIGLNWVGLGDPTWSASSSDCSSNFPTGWCSTVEPNWSFPLVQSWSCFKEIFGGGRGHKYCFSYNFSPVYNLSTLEIQWAGSVPWRIMAFDRVW